MGHYIEVEKGVQVYVEDVGDGKPVVFIHGWPLNHKSFESQMNELPKHGYRFIGIDLRGYGKSDKPWSGYDYDTMAADVNAVVEQLDLKDFFLVGFSMGGPIAIRYMSKYKDQGVKKLLLLAPAAPLFTQRDDFSIGMEPGGVDEIIEQIQTDRPAFLAEFTKMFFAKEKSEEFERWFQSIALEAGSHSTIHSAIALRDEDLRNELEAISVPTVIFHGVNDEICPIELGEELQRKIPTSELVQFDNSGHGLHEDEPELFQQELLDFLKL